MAKKSFQQVEHARLLKKFHTLCTVRGIGQEEKRELLAAYGKESSRDLSVYELIEVCGLIDQKATYNKAEDACRKRLIASISSYLQAMRKPCGVEDAIKVACRAAGVERFNAIPLERLRSLYNAFNQKTKDLRAINGTSAKIIYMSTNKTPGN